MKNKNKILSILLVLVLLFVSACDFNDNSSSPSDKPSYNLSTPGASSGEDNTDEIKELTYTDITLLTSGDIMYHNTQLKSSKNSDGTYDFTDNFKYMKDIVSSADLAVVNYETTTANQKDYTAYPVFNSPLESLAVTKDTGYDLLLFANNHCYDYRKDGFLATLNQFENYGFEYIGGKKTADAKSYMVKDVKGVKLGLMNFTDTITPPTSNYYTINGNAISDGCEELMDIYVQEPPIEMECGERKMTAPEEYVEKESLVVPKYFIDTNHHMNNSKYALVAMRYAEEEIGNNAIQEVRVEYKKEALLGNVMIPRVTKLENEVDVNLVDQNGKSYSIVKFLLKK